MKFAIDGITEFFDQICALFLRFMQNFALRGVQEENRVPAATMDMWTANSVYLVFTIVQSMHVMLTS